MLGSSFSLSAWLFYAASDWATRAGLWILVRMVTNATPVALLMAAFGLLYLTVPNRRVGLLDAAIGGIAAGLAFACLRWGFGFYMANAKTYQSIYGAVASVPLFLFWMYLSWMVVLFGAELAAALPEWRLSREALGGALSAKRRLALSLSLLAALYGEAKTSGQGCSRVELLDRTGEAESELLAVLKRLCQNGFVVKTETGRYVLGRDLSVVTLADIVRLLGLGLASGEDKGHQTPLMEAIASRLNDVAHAEAVALDLPVSQILEVAWEQSAPYQGPKTKYRKPKELVS
jgi:membrane protein